MARHDTTGMDDYASELSMGDSVPHSTTYRGPTQPHIGLSPSPSLGVASPDVSVRDSRSQYSGNEQSHKPAYVNGYNNGYQEGYDQGYQDGRAGQPFQPRTAPSHGTLVESEPHAGQESEQLPSRPHRTSAYDSHLGSIGSQFPTRGMYVELPHINEDAQGEYSATPESTSTFAPNASTPAATYGNFYDDQGQGSGSSGSYHYESTPSDRHKIRKEPRGETSRSSNSKGSSSKSGRRK